MSMSDFQNTAPFFWQTATEDDPESSSVLYLPLEIWLQPFSLDISCAAVGSPPPPPVLASLILSKSGAHPLVLKNFRVLLPDLRVTVTVFVPTVVKLPVELKVRDWAEPPLTLSDALRACP